MRNRRFKEKEKVDSSCDEEIKVTVEEVNFEIERVKKNNFYFIVRSSFGYYKKGDKIDDEESIKRIIESGFTCRVIRVLNK